MELKKQIRQQMIKQRKNMSYEEHKQKSSIICNKIINSDKYKKSKIIFCYAGINNEVCLTELIEHALKNNKKIAMPKVEGKDIDFYYISSIDKLIPGYYNIPEPDTKYPALESDIIIVPGVAFSKKGERLGYGGGFYDRFLAENNIYSIGVGYDFQIFDSLPVEAHDIKIDKIISN